MNYQIHAIQLIIQNTETIENNLRNEQKEYPTAEGGEAAFADVTARGFFEWRGLH